mmetsp:Transcript_58475/g.165156  ORF Transcript_58475/g.165156 Transcript_58475/m.165156 type:complete len:949 (+) Transcript_58475:45-2891(+)
MVNVGGGDAPCAGVPQDALPGSPRPNKRWGAWREEQKAPTGPASAPVSPPALKRTNVAVDQPDGQQLCGSLVLGNEQRGPETDAKEGCEVPSGAKPATSRPPPLSLHVYFGSQTGTSEGFAAELGQEATARGIPATVVDLEDFSPDTFAGHRVVVLIVSTTGEGDPTDNAMDFHRWASSPQNGPATLAGLRFAVFSCGDRNYTNFNQMGVMTDANMKRLGAQPVCARGIGDDSDDVVRDFREWRSGALWPGLEQALAGAMEQAPAGRQGHPGDKAEEDPADTADPVLRVAASSAELPPEAAGQPADVLARFYFQAERARVDRVGELRQAPAALEGLSTAHVGLDVSGCPGLLDYAAAGTVELLPENSAEDVRAILPLLGISEAAKPGDTGDLDCCITFVPPPGAAGKIRKPFPVPCSLRDALTRYCDLRRAPTRQMLVAVRPRLQPGARERVDRLLADASAMQIVQDENLGWTQWEFWPALGVSHLDLGAFLLHCPRQRARPFTLASSPLATPNEMHVCSSLVSHPALHLDDAVAALRAKGILPDGCEVPARQGRWFGLCSHWLCTRVRPNDVVLARARPSAFRLAAEDVPLVMVGAGAGVAPFRGFWHELRARPPRAAPATLFFACRHPEHDWIYRSEMKEAAAGCGGEGGRPPPLSNVVTAFSRLGDDGAYDSSGCCGSYVQERLREKGQDVRECHAAGGVIYICGNNQASQAVLKAIGEVLGQGDAEMQALRQAGRILVESWGDSLRAVQAVEAAGAPAAAVAGEPGAVAADGLSKELLEAVKNGAHSDVQRLLAAGADVNFQAGARKYTRIGLRQEVGETALHWASLRGDKVVAEWLLGARADPDLRDQDGKPALHIAAFNGVADVMETLLGARCNPDAQDLRGNTALHWVLLAGGSVRMVKLLIKYSARCDLPNVSGETPADAAEEEGAQLAASLMRKALGTA